MLLCAALLSAVTLLTSGCAFVPHRDYGDGGEPAINATSPEECCELCKASAKCAVSVFGNWSGGQCYLKDSNSIPIDKPPSVGIVSCDPGKPVDRIKDKFYDCQFRELAYKYTFEHVVGSWANGDNAVEALQAVENGLRLSECPPVPTRQQSSSDKTAATLREEGIAAPEGGSATTVYIFVAVDGNDAAEGSRTAPLKTITAAKAKIRALYPAVETRPPVTVALLPGDYYMLNPRTPVATGTKTPPAVTTFSALDSGSSPGSPVTYTAAASLDGSRNPEPVTLHGGVLASDLAWKKAAGSGATTGVWQTTLPANIQVDVQDQLYYSTASPSSAPVAEPLIRARLPNGRPWNPMDGFNLTTAPETGSGPSHQPMPRIPRSFTSCASVKPQPPDLPPTPFDPSLPEPPVGECSPLVASASLLYGYPKSDLPLASSDMDTAADCEALCKETGCCYGFTWHDNTTGPYFKKCYFVTNPITPWSRAIKQVGHVSGICNQPNSSSTGGSQNPICSTGSASFPCKQSNVVCASSNVTQVDGPLGVATGSATALGGNVLVNDCMAHLPDMGNNWPEWKAQSYGDIDVDNSTYTWINRLDSTQNNPLWYGPWAGGIIIDGTQDPGGNINTSTFSWPHPEDMVVHAMADGEWGGVQFRVASASKVPGQPVDTQLTFSYGGWQQARGAELSHTDGTHGNRFYVEGNIEFLDTAGEWHLDQQTRVLSLIPPDGLITVAGGVERLELDLVVTQADSLFHFLGSSSTSDSDRVKNIVVANMTLAHTSAQFFLPHEETSGGDYAVHRGGAIFAENATMLKIVGNKIEHIGGNGVFLSNSVRNVSVRENTFSFLGTSGVSLVGRTGGAMMDARDGEAMVAAAAASASTSNNGTAGSATSPSVDNLVRFPKDNLVEHNIFHDYGIWDKQSAAFHKALAPGNRFSNNVCFNSSRHGVNFQDSMGGAGVVSGNVFFNLNRETSDTSALNSWGRRNYIISDSEETPAKPRLMPAQANSWRGNLILNRNYYGVRDGNGNALRCDDGASWYNMSGNVMYNAGMEFNGGTQVFSHGNLFVHGGWTVCAAPPDYGGGSNDIFVDNQFMWTSICGMDKCLAFYKPNQTNHTAAGNKPCIYKGNFNTIVQNSTGTDPGQNPGNQMCGLTLGDWQSTMHQDLNTVQLNANGTGEYSSERIMIRAHELMWSQW